LSSATGGWRIADQVGEQGKLALHRTSTQHVTASHFEHFPINGKTRSRPDYNACHAALWAASRRTFVPLFDDFAGWVHLCVRNAAAQIAAEDFVSIFIGCSLI